MTLEEKQQNILIANRIKQIREAKGLTRKQLEERSGLTQAIINALETGLTKVSLEHLISVSKGLGCSLDYLVGLDVSIETKQGRLRLMFDEMDVLTQDYILSLMQHLKTYMAVNNEDVRRG